MKNINLRDILRFNCERDAHGSFHCDINKSLPDLKLLAPFVQSVYRVDVKQLSMEEWRRYGNAPIIFGEVLGIAYEKTIYRYREPDFPDDRPCDSGGSILDFIEYLYHFKNHMQNCGYSDFGQYVYQGALSAYGLINDAFRNTEQVKIVVT